MIRQEEMFKSAVSLRDKADGVCPGFEQKIVERFHRDRSKPASEDVEERVFLVSENRIELTYHHEDDRITSACRSFVKPHNLGDTKNEQPFTSEMVSTYQVKQSCQASELIILQVFYRN